MDERGSKVATEAKARTLAILGVVVMIFAAIVAVAGLLFSPDRSKIILYILSGVFALTAAVAFVLANNVERKQPGWGANGSRKFLQRFIAAILVVVSFSSIFQLVVNYVAFRSVDIGSMLQAVVSFAILAWFLKSKKMRKFFSGPRA